MNNIYRIKDINRNLELAGFGLLDVLLVGGTGTGKSSTMNALFQREVATVGRDCDPETVEISPSELNDSLRFWDTPGLGDSIENDEHYAEELTNILYEDYYMDGKQYGLIDTVLVILDGSGRDMGTTYKILNEIIIPNFQADRILVAINQADIAMKGRHWDEQHNCPDNILMNFLCQKAKSIQDRIKEATGIDIHRPVFYSAERGFNMEGLLDMIIDGMPKERRCLVA